eukprot:s2414_g5.t1
MLIRKAAGNMSGPCKAGKHFARPRSALEFGAGADRQAANDSVCFLFHFDVNWLRERSRCNICTLVKEQLQMTYGVSLDLDDFIQKVDSLCRAQLTGEDWDPQQVARDLDMTSEAWQHMASVALWSHRGCTRPRVATGASEYSVLQELRGGGELHAWHINCWGRCAWLSNVTFFLSFEQRFMSISIAEN